MLFSAPETFNFDIALVKLAQPVQLNEFVNVVCLPAVGDAFPAGTRCLTAGWGHTEEGSSAFTLAVHGSRKNYIYLVYLGENNDVEAPLFPYTSNFALFSS